MTAHPLILVTNDSSDVLDLHKNHIDRDLGGSIISIGGGHQVASCYDHDFAISLI